MIFRAPSARVAADCRVLALGVAWAIRAELATSNISVPLGRRADATILMEVVLLGGLRAYGWCA